MKRYKGTFRATEVSKEREFESDDLAQVKTWLAGKIEKTPSPSYAAITDHEEDRKIFEESNP